MQLGFNFWAWTWCNISRPRKSGTLGGGTGGTCGTRCPGTFAFLEPKEFLEPVEPVKRMGFHRFQTFLGFKHAWFHRFHTGSTQVPHRFHTGSTQVPWVQPRHWFHSFQTGSLGSTTPLVPQLPDRFLGFKHAMVPQVPHRLFVFNSPLVPQVPDRFLGFNHAMGSTTPWVQQVPRRFLGFNHATGSRQVLWVETRWFHKFQTVSLGSTAPLIPQVPDRFLGFNHAMGSTG